jgi:CHAT domain-containing protein
LPRARIEAQEIVRRVGGSSELLVGDAATEGAFKQATLRDYGVIHLAAHALVDHETPERSAIVLAAGSEEDGLLQMREIVDLDLDRGVVVLSACRSAAGPQIEGEGVMSLARAFFAAGAATVVGSLWPLRDDEAEPLFREFYDRLARGETVSAAMAGARRARIRAAAPPASWAGVIVLGEGGVAPIARSARIPPAWLAGGVAVSIALVTFVLWRRSH